MKIILLVGKAGSGKNEVAKIIKNNIKKSVITSFSKYIKIFTLELTNWDGDEDNKPRSYLQEMGDKLRAIDENFLIKRVEEDLIVYKKEGIDVVIVSDVRLIHEILYFENSDYDVITIKIESDKCMRNLTIEQREHRTEVELDEYNSYDYIIRNKFDDTLEKDVIKILEEEKLK